jgi:hypothetical protein
MAAQSTPTSTLLGSTMEDLETTDFFGYVDGDDGLVGMATPSSNASTMTVTPMLTATVTPMAPQGLGHRTRTMSTTRAQGRNHKTHT